MDDNDDTRAMYSELLTAAGYSVITAENGADALGAAAAQQPSVILMDLAMPGLNGWEATRRLKTDEATSAIPIIVLTAHDLAHYKDVALAAGCDAFLSKPCPLEDLVAAIRRFAP